MKKTRLIISASLFAFLAIGASSCMKNNVTPPQQAQDPSLEAAAIGAFINANGYNMVEKTDSSTIIANTAYGLIKETIATPGLMYEVVTQGDMSSGSVNMADTAIGGTHIGDSTMVFNTVSDSTQYVSVRYKATLLNGTIFDSTAAGKSALIPLPNTLTSWEALIGKIGKGGHIRFVTPSKYGYGPQAYAAIPANSPLFFDVYLMGTVKTTYQP